MALGLYTLYFILYTLYFIQAGVTLGLAHSVAVEFVGWGEDFNAVVVGVSVLNQARCFGIIVHQIILYTLYFGPQHTLYFTLSRTARRLPSCRLPSCPPTLYVGVTRCRCTRLYALYFILFTLYLFEVCAASARPDPDGSDPVHFYSLLYFAICYRCSARS